jgi:hypothetical protein
MLCNHPIIYTPHNISYSARHWINIECHSAANCQLECLQPLGYPCQSCNCAQELAALRVNANKTRDSQRCCVLPILGQLDKSQIASGLRLNFVPKERVNKCNLKWHYPTNTACIQKVNRTLFGRPKWIFPGVYLVDALWKDSHILCEVWDSHGREYEMWRRVVWYRSTVPMFQRNTKEKGVFSFTWLSRFEGNWVTINYLITYLLTYLLHGAESFLSS